MSGGSEKATIEIVDGIPVLMRPSDGKRPRIRTQPISLKKKRVQHPESISTKERKALTIQQRQALGNVFSGMTKKEAGIKAGYAKSCAISCVNNALSLAAGNAAFLKEMDKQGITHEKLIGILKEGLEATHPLSKDDKKDYRTIHSYLQDSIKLLDGFPAKRMKTESDHRHMHIHITTDDRQALDKVEQMRQEAIDASPDPY